MTRLPDWHIRLHALVQERQAKPFAWGEHDCALWAADVVHALTGEDPAKEWRGTYSTALEAARVLRELGGMEAMATRTLGEPIAPLMARVGDVGLLESCGRECFAVCNGDHWMAPGEHGLDVADLYAAKKAWRVGE